MSIEEALFAVQRNGNLYSCKGSDLKTDLQKGDSMVVQRGDAISQWVVDGNPSITNLDLIQDNDLLVCTDALGVTRTVTGAQFTELVEPYDPFIKTADPVVGTSADGVYYIITTPTQGSGGKTPYIEGSPTWYDSNGEEIFDWGTGGITVADNFGTITVKQPLFDGLGQEVEGVTTFTAKMPWENHDGGIWHLDQTGYTRSVKLNKSYKIYYIDDQGNIVNEVSSSTFSGGSKGIILGDKDASMMYMNGTGRIRFGDMTDTSKVTNMFGLFANVSNTIIQTSYIDTSNVTDMSSIFEQAKQFNDAGVTSWNTTNVTNMCSTFDNAQSFNQNINPWDVSNVKDMAFMFNNAKNFNSDISSWTTNSVTNMSQMFNSASAFNVDISNWNTTNVTNMFKTFNYTTAFNQPIGKWDVSNITNFSNMFRNAREFRYDLSDWCVRRFSSAPSGSDGWYWASGSPLYEEDRELQPCWGACPRGEDNQGQKPCPKPWEKNYKVWWHVILNNASDLSVTNQSGYSTANIKYFNVANEEQVSSITSGGEWIVSGSVTFNNSKNFQIGPLTNTSLETKMQSQFYGSEFNNSLQYVDASNVTNMNAMFRYARNFNDPSISNLNVSKVQDFQNMFGDAYAFNQDLNTWTTSSGTSFHSVFYNAINFNGNVSSWDVSNGVRFNSMFGFARKFNRNLSSWNVGKGYYFNQMFRGADIYNQPLNNWNMASARNTDEMFLQAGAFNQPLNSWNVSRITNVQSMFSNARQFDQPLNNWKFNSTNLTTWANMKYMFMNSKMSNDISMWCVDKISQYPTDFATNAPINNTNKLPKWGTCPP